MVLDVEYGTRCTKKLSVRYEILSREEDKGEMLVFLRKLLFVCVFLFVPKIALSYDVLDVCARYTNTGSAYKVQAHVMKGSELNRRTRSYDYWSWATYAIIFWGAGQATVIQINSYCSLNLYLPCYGNDQQGYRWSITRANYLCH